MCVRSIQLGGQMFIDQSGNLKARNITADTITASRIARPLATPAPSVAAKRQEDAYDVRINSAYAEYLIPLPTHSTNGDEDNLSPPYIGSFTKGMNHNNLGEVVPADFEALVKATTTGNPADYDAIPTGNAWIKYHSPQSGNAFDLEGGDSRIFSIPPAPQFSSAWRAAEAVENYWMAIMRDVNFTDYGTNSGTDARAGYPDGVTAAALADLNSLSDFRGPKVGGMVTADTLFRGEYSGNLVGPYISQFLLLNCPYGATHIDQKMRTPVAGVDYLTDVNSWLNIQRGHIPSAPMTFDPTKRYIRNGRDMAEWVHMDVLYQAYFQAGLVMTSLGVPVNQGNPYKNSTNQVGFATFGGPHIATLIAEVCSRALKAIWFQKWNVHRVLRPEAFGGRVHQVMSETANYPIHPDVLNSDAIARVYAENGTWLLPQAFPEGCPPHPSYGAGHATVSAACVTILKAWFDCSGTIPSPVVPSADGLTLEPYVGPALTIEGELHKVSANVGIGRNIAGVHWRSDYDSSVSLGEEVAISVLRDQKKTYTENFAGFTFNKFDGTRITV